MTRKTRSVPTEAQFSTAILWLESNEGAAGGVEDREGGEEQAACFAVTAWLSEYLRDQELKRAARQGGIPVARLREVVAAAQKGKDWGIDG